jgi:hypothetical protein
MWIISFGCHVVTVGSDLRANTVDPYAFTSVDYGQLTRHGKYCTLKNRSDSNFQMQ